MSAFKAATKRGDPFTRCGQGKGGLWRMLAIAALAVGLTRSATAAADDTAPLASYNDFGETGLLQTPSGRMAPDGDFALGFSWTWPYTRYFVSSQFLPWLQGTFRYTDITNRPYGPASLTSQSYKDKSVGVRLRLVEESATWPEISMGLRDIGGSSFFSDEYFVATRRYYDWDFTAGVAWGNGGSYADAPNPFGYLSARFKTRPPATTAGAFTTDYFRGQDIGFFGGAEYRTPIDGLRLKLEFDGNSYQQEPLNNKLPVKSRVNVGAEYSPFGWMDFAAGFERGDRLMTRLVLHANLQTDKGVPKLDEKPPPEVYPRHPEEQAARTEIAAPLAANPAEPASTPAPDATAAPVPLAAPVAEVVPAPILPAAAPPVPMAGADLGKTIADVFDDPALVIESIDIRESHVVVRFLEIPDAKPLQGIEERWNDSAGTKALRLTLLGLDGKEIAAPAALIQKEAGTDAATFGKPLFDALAAYDLTGLRVFVEGDTATLAFEQNAYRETAKPIGRAARLLANAAPPQVERLNLILMKDGAPLKDVTLLRRDVESAASGLAGAEETWMHTTVRPPESPDERPDEYDETSWPDASFGLMPRLRQSLGGPNSFWLYQVYAEPSVRLRLSQGLSLSGAAGINLSNNFDKFTYQAPSELPRVRTYIRNYLTDSNAWVEALHADQVFSPLPDWYGRVSAGVFEQMYSGADGEILYRPAQRSWALGLDINHVWQRSFDGQFGLRKYNVTTGNLTYYQATPFHNVYYSISAGRYLARDVGATLTVGRRFENGAEVGIWATKTNVSAAQFGEGSFDKGFYVKIPLDLFMTTPNSEYATFPFQPLIRDGGQKVDVPMSLYDLTGGANTDVGNGGWRDLWK